MKGDKWDYWRVRTSCPPDTQLHMNGGWYVAPASWGDGYTYWRQDLTVDMTDLSLVNLTHEWVNAYWYVPTILVWTWYGSYTFRLYGTDVTSFTGYGYEEFETYTEAEAALDAFVTSSVDETGLPLCRLMLRNDGRTGQVLEEGTQIAAIQAIDPVNRGRSYLWGRFRRTYTI